MNEFRLNFMYAVYTNREFDCEYATFIRATLHVDHKFTGFI
jgi:hypothetical protein